MRLFPSASTRTVAFALTLLLLAGCAAVKAPDKQAGAATSASQTATAATESGAANTLCIPVFTRTSTDPATTLIKLFTGASKDIDIACYSFTHPEIIKAVLAAQKRGVKIRVLTDREQTRGKTQQQAMEELVKAGIPVKVNAHPGLMNLRMSIIDGNMVATGSYNYNQLTGKNNDEMLVTINDADFTAACEKEFNQMWGNTREFSSLKNNSRPAPVKSAKAGTTHETGKTHAPATHSQSSGQHAPVTHN
ncbi:phospholipase D-like domain-containing protein [Desulfotomaculum copahuensis]|uniref:phospholipase D n=1 Tax=Desulfotomaculum copahuensis TaxID=1838280 RepID=A0A1B7LAE7_9FIRM|nr:phospholipase D-like domain-containing protein [Desulfotomaculum copahuensis]OAT79293.1 hypothetical protein A6M21_16430 [Desulfotomaculum copahuensis]